MVVDRAGQDHLLRLVAGDPACQRGAHAGRAAAGLHRQRPLGHPQEGRFHHLRHIRHRSRQLARPTGSQVGKGLLLRAAQIAPLGIVLARTTTGRYLYAAGGNPEAARLAGIRVNAVRILGFTLSGVAAALGGIVDTSRVLSAQASPGTALTFTVLAGIVVGGTSILGGEGAVWRTVVGVLFIALVGNGFNLLGVDALFQQITLGVILLVAVGIDAWSRVLRR